MRKTLLVIVLAVIMLMAMSLGQVQAAVEVERVAGCGSGYVDGDFNKAQFYMPSLISVVKDDIYVLDGVSIRRIANGQVETVASLWDAEDELDDYDLDEEPTIWSFRFGNMLYQDGKLYLSGLMYKKDVKVLPHLSPKSSGWTRNGFTYNVFFEIDPAGDVKLLRVSKAYCNIVPRTGNYIQGLWDSRPDVVYKDGKWLYGYYYFVPVPEIQPMRDGSFLVLESLENGTEDIARTFWLAKWYPDGHEEKLFNLSKLEHRYCEWDPIPNTKYTVPQGLLDVTAIPQKDGTVFIVDGRNHYYLDIDSGELTHWDPTDFMERGETQRGRKIGEDCYFLDSYGVWVLKPDRNAYRIVEAKFLDYSGKVMGYDISGDNVIVGNYTRGTIDRFVLSDLDKYRQNAIYVNGKAVLPIEKNSKMVHPWRNDVLINVRIINKILNVEAEPTYYPHSMGINIYHPSGRSVFIKGLVPGYRHDVTITNLVKAYNSISPMKLEGKYENGSVYLKTIGTTNSQDDGPKIYYGLPANE